MIRPLGDKILVKKIKLDKPQKGLIYLANDEKSIKYQVLAIGADVKNIEIGNHLHLNKNMLTPVDGEEEVFFIPLTSVFGVDEEVFNP